MIRRQGKLNPCWNKLWGKGHSLVPWLLDAPVLPTLGGGDDAYIQPLSP